MGTRVYMRHVQWEIVVPLGLEWGFMQSFGKAFRTKDAMDGTERDRPVDRYFEHPAGWHIFVTVHESEEKKLAEFCKDYSAACSSSFEGSETANMQEADTLLVALGYVLGYVVTSMTFAEKEVGRLTSFPLSHVRELFLQAKGRYEAAGKEANQASPKG